MTSKEIARQAVRIRADIEMLHETAVRALEIAATAAIDDHCGSEVVMPPTIIDLREALLALELTREMRV